MCHIPNVTCNLSHVTSFMPYVTCYMSCVTCQLSAQWLNFISDIFFQFIQNFSWKHGSSHIVNVPLPESRSCCWYVWPQFCLRVSFQLFSCCPSTFSHILNKLKLKQGKQHIMCLPVCGQITTVRYSSCLNIRDNSKWLFFSKYLIPSPDFNLICWLICSP